MDKHIKSEEVASSSAGILILQWLTSAFWGWTVLSLSVLTGLVISNFLKGSDTGTYIEYAIAAVLVLLPISAFCDYLYSKHEPLHKSGAALVIMVIHSVLFALFGIGSLIVAVFSLVSLATSSSDPSSILSTLYTALIIAVIYAITFVRTLNPTKATWARRSYTFAMIFVVGIATVLGFVGPVSYARQTRDDKLIEANLPLIQGQINTYVSENKKLPTSLYQLDLSGDPKQLVKRNLAAYTPNTKPPKPTNLGTPEKLIYPAPNQEGISYYYTLCVNYKKKSKNTYPEKTFASIDSGYVEYIQSYTHAAGNVCYKLISTNFERGIEPAVDRGPAQKN